MVDEALDITAGANIRRLRTALGMSQTELANYLGETFRQQTVLKVEQGTRPLKLAEAAAIAEVFHVRVEDLYARGPDVELVVQVEGVTRMVMDEYEAAVRATALLESRRRSLAGMLTVASDALPPGILKLAQEWSADTLLEEARAEAVAVGARPQTALRRGVRVSADG